MLRNISGKVALITGASRGIGRAIARTMAEEGCSLALMARNTEALQETAESCNSFGVKTVCIPVDITNFQQLRIGIDRAAEELGGIDILVNNAGIGRLASVLTADPAEWAELLNVNLLATMEATRLTLPYLVKRNGGTIIFIASLSAKITYSGGAAYCASKHAITGFAGALYEDVRGHNIKVCSICPGYVNTEMISDFHLDGASLIQPEDVAEAVRFVARFPDTGCPTEILIRSQRPPYI